MKIIKAIKVFTVNTVILASFLSCNAQNNKTIETTDLRECINETVNKYAKESYGKAPFDFYSFMQEIEHQLIAYKLINNPKRKSYLDLLSEIESEKKDLYENFYSKSIKLMEDKGFDFNLYGINNAVFSKCPYEVLTKVDGYEKTPYYRYAILLDKVMNNGYNNQEIIKELLTSVDKNKFKELHYRAPIVLLALINIDLKFNPIEPMEKFEVEDKTYFKPKEKE